MDRQFEIEIDQLITGMALVKTEQKNSDFKGVIALDRRFVYVLKEGTRKRVGDYLF
jgi:hypothetical protein